MRTPFSKPSRLQRALCALLLLPGLWAPALPFVVCIEPGGRVVVESGQAMCDEPGAAAANSEDALALEPSPDCCGPCTDLPIEGVRLRQPNSERTLVQLVITSATAPVALSPALSAPRLEATSFAPEPARDPRSAGSCRLAPLRC